jgi:putative Holliday junction resolvase
MSQGRILALDYGEKNVGLACTDELGLLVRPLPSLSNKGRRGLLTQLRSVVIENNIACIVVGMPWNMNGTLGPSGEQVRAFIQLLQRELELPLREMDERLSTMEAAELWKSMNRRQHRRYRTVDSLAAALILQRYLEESRQ